MTAIGTGQAAPGTEELDHLAARVAVLGLRAEDAKSAYLAARAIAEPRFALARAHGVTQLAVMLPGGVEAGKLALKQGRQSVDVDEGELLLLIAEAMPSEVEDYAVPAAGHDERAVKVLAEHAPDLVELRVKDGALSDARAVALLAEHCPDLVERRVTPAFRAEMQSYIEAHDGNVPHPMTGEAVKVATITHHDPTGDFSWTGKSKYLGRVREALDSGRLVVTASGDVRATVAGVVEAPEAIGGTEAA